MYTRVLSASGERNSQGDFDLKTTFSLNPKFASKQKRLQLNVIVKGDNEVSPKEIEAKAASENEIAAERESLLEVISLVTYLFIILFLFLFSFSFSSFSDRNCENHESQKDSLAHCVG